MSAPMRAGGVLALLFLALHLLALPVSLEDLDSINFALGIGDFDVSRHQPHPPGYPIFIAAAKLLHAIGLSEVRALSLLGVFSGALAILALIGIFDETDRDASAPPPWLTAAVIATSPLYWLTASRPLSDAAGLAASLGVQLLLLRARTPRGLAVAAFCAAAAAGIRSQVVWLTLPLLVLTMWRLRGVLRSGGVLAAGAAYGIGALSWLVPLVWVSGGVSTYWQAFSNQGAEDLSGVAMLATTPTPRQAIKALQYTFVAPWGYWQFAAFVLVLAALGVVRVWQRSPQMLTTLAWAFGPYAVFDVLFQETITTRYALPLVVPVSYLAVRGASWLPELPSIGLALTIVGFAVVIDNGMLYAFASSAAPAFRMLGDMDAARQQAGSGFRPPVLAMHRREEFDLRRSIQWVGERMPPVAAKLPSTAKHEWLEVVKYWNSGGRDPVWFVADPLRSDLALFHAQSRPTVYTWSFEPTILLGGSRPSVMDWHVIDAPDWYVGEGWALTPETAGIAGEDGKGPGIAPIEGWVRRTQGVVNLAIGGRNATTTGTPATLRFTIDGQPLDDAQIAPGFFLRLLQVPSLAGTGDYARVTIASDSRDLAIEQFDAQPAGRVVYGYGDGWNEQEYNPATGVLWRWTSDRATWRVRAEGHALALTLRGEIEEASSSHVRILANGQLVTEFDVDRQFSRTVLIPATAVAQPESAITIETSAWYVPAETRWRSSDRRRLGLKLIESRLSPAS